ncbi:MAG: glycosyltransferase [Thermodesulfobacteriota bacterium]
MKVFCGLRLFSGFETSLAERRWRPTGAPTIYKLMEALDAAEDPVFVLTHKESYMPWGRGDAEIPVQGLRTPLRVLARRGGAGRMGEYRNEAAQSLALFAAARRERPDVAYFTSANFLAAALVARYTRIPTVLRVMGVYPAQREALVGKRLVHKVSRWAYRSPFACVVCTQDGSGGEGWLVRAFNPGVRKELLVNGVDLPADLPPMDPALAALPADRTVVAAVGKLERDKGAMEFMRGFLAAWSEAPEGLHALVVGAGSLGQDMRRLVGEGGAGGAVTFIDRLPHVQIPWVHRRADVYVSLNRLGNLSNANLEAMRAGACMVFPRSRPDTGVDLATDALVPEDAVARIPHADDIAALARELLVLHRDPGRRQRMRERIREASRGFIPTWGERVGQELAILRGLAARPGAAPPGQGKEQP